MDECMNVLCWAVGTVGFCTTSTSMVGVATATLFAILAVVTSAGAGAEAAVMGAVSSE